MAYPVLVNMPGSQYLWMLRFISIALTVLMVSFFFWNTLKRKVIFIIAIALTLESIVAIDVYKRQLLSHEEVEINGRKVVPFDVIVNFMPKPPKFEHEIKEIIDEGIVSDDGCMVVEAYGKKDGKDILVENHVFAPGIVESFEKAKMTGEMYLTGQGGFLFSKMFVNDEFDMTGLITSDMLPMDKVDKMCIRDRI